MPDNLFIIKARCNKSGNITKSMNFELSQCEFKLKIVKN